MILTFIKKEIRLRILSRLAASLRRYVIMSISQKINKNQFYETVIDQKNFAKIYLCYRWLSVKLTMILKANNQVQEMQLD